MKVHIAWVVAAVVVLTGMGMQSDNKTEVWEYGQLVIRGSGGYTFSAEWPSESPGGLGRAGFELGHNPTAVVYGAEANKICGDMPAFSVSLENTSLPDGEFDPLISSGAVQYDITRPVEWGPPSKRPKIPVETDTRSRIYWWCNVDFVQDLLDALGLQGWQVFQVDQHSSSRMRHGRNPMSKDVHLRRRIN